jgi:hypothetical protein
MNLQQVVKHIALCLVMTQGLLACGGGGSSSHSGQENQSNLAFVTSVSGSGNLGSWPDAGGATGLAAADAICQARAEAAGLSGTFVAWLSDSSDDAYCRVQGLTGKRSDNCGQATLPADAGPWVRTDGSPFSATLDQLTDGNVIYTPLRYDEFGTEIAGGISTGVFFTGTNYDGSVFDDAGRTTCADWTAASTELADAGNVDGTSTFWTSQYGIRCDSTLPLACFQTGAGPALPDFAMNGKKVFLTSVGSDGALGGVAGGDAHCQQLASAAGLTGSFKAWLSDGTSNIVDRLVSDGPWVRMDGVKLADNKADLTDGRLFTSISVDENGFYYAPIVVFTGTDFSGMVSTSHCQNWTSNAATETGTRGSSANADSAWTGPVTSFSCDQEIPLFCFED